MYQQTIEIALDTWTGQLYEASQLLSLSESDFTAMRREAMANRNARKKEDTSPRWVCLICKRPLFISRYIMERGNRWFVHDGGAPDCPWSEGRRLSPDVRRALIYRGQQEGPEHRRLKEFIASWLERDPAVTDVKRDRVTFGQVLKGEWKRPDVQCCRAPNRIVFEIQLSYTFLSEVIKRDDFYREEGTFIVWVFRSFDLRRSTVRDEAFFNKRNLFVLDEEAIAETLQSQRLVFGCYFQRPTVTKNGVEDIWERKTVTLDDIAFPVPSYRPFYFDYDKGKLEANAILAGDEQKCESQAWAEGIRRYLVAAIAYYESGYAKPLEQTVLDVTDELHESPHWHRGYEVLMDPEFYGWHRVLPVLLSIKHNRAIGYKNETAFRVLEAGLRQTVRRGHYSFAVMYLWAYRAYKPTVTKSQRDWTRNIANKLRKSVEAGETMYYRDTRFDVAVTALFPELEDKLATPWATATYIPKNGMHPVS